MGRTNTISESIKSLSIRLRINLTVSVLVMATFASLSVIGVTSINSAIQNTSSELLAELLDRNVQNILSAIKTLTDVGLADDKEQLNATKNQLIEQIKSFKYKKTGQIYIIESKGKVISHPTIEANADLSKLAYIHEITQKKNGQVSYQSTAGENSVAAFAHVPVWDWLLCLEVSENELFHERNLFIKKTAIIIGVGFAIAITFGFVLSSSITKGLNHNIIGLSSAADSVTLASSQVASASQILAEISTQQAASLQETTASLEEMSAMIKQNADNAGGADRLMKVANEVAKNANGTVAKLTTSMNEISRASEETSKIIKTIDSIAFQTNLLALNAAVEAARAGVHGAGFAVVANEVRNLAMRSAEASKGTAQLLDQIVTKIKNGSDLVTQTRSAFEQVTESVTRGGSMVADIAVASEEQVQLINQFNTQMSTMNDSVQHLASGAEESASVSHEMNNHADQMKEIITELITLGK